MIRGLIGLVMLVGALSQLPEKSINNDCPAMGFNQMVSQENGAYYVRFQPTDQSANLNWVDVHITVPGGAQQNYHMQRVNGYFEAPVIDEMHLLALQSGQGITYSFTYCVKLPNKDVDCNTDHFFSDGAAREALYGEEGPYGGLQGCCDDVNGKLDQIIRTGDASTKLYGDMIRDNRKILNQILTSGDATTNLIQQMQDELTKMREQLSECCADREYLREPQGGEVGRQEVDYSQDFSQAVPAAPAVNFAHQQIQPSLTLASVSTVPVGKLGHGKRGLAPPPLPRKGGLGKGGAGVGSYGVVSSYSAGVGGYGAGVGGYNGAGIGSYGGVGNSYGPGVPGVGSYGVGSYGRAGVGGVGSYGRAGSYGL